MARAITSFASGGTQPSLFATTDFVHVYDDCCRERRSRHVPGQGDQEDVDTRTKPATPLRTTAVQCAHRTRHAQRRTPRCELPQLDTSRSGTEPVDDRKSTSLNSSP